MHATIPQSCSDRAQLTDAELEVRRIPCSLCGAPPLEICQRRPRAEHLQRWLDAYVAGRIGDDDIGQVFRRVVIITRWQVVPERSAA